MALLTLTQAAGYLGIPVRLLRRLVRDSQVAHYRPYRKALFFATEDLDAWREGARVPTWWEARLVKPQTTPVSSSVQRNDAGGKKVLGEAGIIRRFGQW